MILQHGDSVSFSEISFASPDLDSRSKTWNLELGGGLSDGRGWYSGLVPVFAGSLLTPLLHARTSASQPTWRGTRPLNLPFADIDNHTELSEEPSSAWNEKLMPLVISWKSSRCSHARQSALAWISSTKEIVWKKQYHMMPPLSGMTQSANYTSFERKRELVNGRIASLILTIPYHLPREIPNPHAAPPMPDPNLRSALRHRHARMIKSQTRRRIMRFSSTGLKRPWSRSRWQLLPGQRNVKQKKEWMIQRARPTGMGTFKRKRSNHLHRKKRSPSNSWILLGEDLASLSKHVPLGR